MADLKTAPALHYNFFLLVRGMLRTLSLIHQVKLFSPFSQHARYQQISPYNLSFIIIIQSFGCKEILITLYHAKKQLMQFCSMYLIQGSQRPSQHLSSSSYVCLYNQMDSEDHFYSLIDKLGLILNVLILPSGGVALGRVCYRQGYPVLCPSISGGW